MAASSLPSDLALESLEVGATPLIQRFLQRLDLPALFERHLPSLPGRPPDLPTPVVLTVLISNLLIARQPLYAIADWVSRRVPQHLGLLPAQLAQFNDDRCGRALDHLHRADRASLLTAVVRHSVVAFDVILDEFHQDTTTVTFSGHYHDQPPVEQAQRPPYITFGFNKDHRPDLKQLLFSITTSSDGAVPVHCKIYDGNTTDDAVHVDSWQFCRDLLGHADFLYVADSKLCTRDNMNYISDRHGRFLTVMPRTRSEDTWFRNHVQSHELLWREVRRQPHPRRRDGPEVVYHGVESPQRSVEGYRILWYRSSQKEREDRQARADRLRRARARLEQLRPVGRGGVFTRVEQAQAAGFRVLEQEQVQGWLRLRIVAEVQEEYRQTQAGRPGPNTVYKRVAKRHYRIEVEEEGEALRREARCDGLFPLMSNDETLSLQEALAKYKYQPFVEKRHEQLKSVFAVMPMWLKSVSRIESLLWLYFVVELLQALLERQVRQSLARSGQGGLPLYPEGRVSTAPTSEQVLRVLEGHRRHRLLDKQGQELRCFYDALSPVAEEVLTLLNVDRTAYGLNNLP
jgi:transposase